MGRREYQHADGKDKGHRAADPMTGRGNRSGTTLPALVAGPATHDLLQIKTPIARLPTHITVPGLCCLSTPAPRRNVTSSFALLILTPRAQFTPLFTHFPVNIAVAFLRYERTQWLLCTNAVTRGYVLVFLFRAPSLFYKLQPPTSKGHLSSLSQRTEEQNLFVSSRRGKQPYQPTTVASSTEMLRLSGGRRHGVVVFLPCLAVVVVVVVLAAAPRGADAYKNYTVGDDKGWYDGLTLPGVDYQAWADDIKNFSLGDFLIFNTDKNHSVVQTRNATVYKSCDYNDSGPDDTVEWSAAAPEFSKDAVTVAVPLLKEGRAYFFSGNYDGEQCENGQRFAIDVAHGQGLPPDLRPPAVADAPAPSSSDDGAAVLDFSHPKNVTTPSASDSDDGELSGDATSGSGCRTPARLGSGLAVMTILIAALFAV